MFEKKEMRDMTHQHFGSQKLDKSKELNETMTIKEKEKDSYEKSIHTLGGRK